MTNNTIHNVPRELLERAWRALANSATGREIGAYLDADPCAPECAETCARASMCATCSAALSAPSPAGVDGCKCSMSISMLGDGCRHCQPQEYIDRLGEMLDEERSELSDAQAIIDGLRGEVAEERAKVAQLEEGIPRIMEASYQFRQQRDQQAQRIGELEGLLREVHDTYRAAIHWEDLRGTMRRIDAAVSAGKEGE